MVVTVECHEKLVEFQRRGDGRNRRGKGEEKVALAGHCSLAVILPHYNDDTQRCMSDPTCWFSISDLSVPPAIVLISVALARTRFGLGGGLTETQANYINHQPARQRHGEPGAR